MTRPAIPVGVLDHLRADRVEFNVPATGEKIPLRVDQRRPETPFPQSARAMDPCVDVADELPSDQLHHARRAVAFFRRDQEMHVIRHEDVGMYRTSKTAAREL